MAPPPLVRWSESIGPGPRPWTDAGLADALGLSTRSAKRRVYYADSAARDQLARALDRYVRREISGAAFLLAAERGTGKTTTFEWVVQSLYAECLANQEYRRHRPLLVRLYGPNLAPVRVAPPPADTGSPNDSSKDERERQPPVLQLLCDIGVSLFEAVLSEIERTIHIRREREPERHASDVELFLQLRHEMRRGPTVATLMAYWERLGWGKDGAFSTQRGAAEVAVLQDLAEARLAVVSKVQDKRDNKASLDAQVDVTRTVQPGELLKTSAAVIAGAAAAAGLVLDGSWILAGLLGPLVTAGVGATLTFTSTFKRKQSQNDELLYTLDANVQSLLHRIPRLLQGLRQIGLHPVFAVDELDKVDPTLVTYLISNLKTQVTEQSFFCFVTDDESAAAGDQADTGQEGLAYSLFWDRIYLFQTTPALHGYLQTYLAENEAAAGSQREAVAVLRHVLLLRAEHHTLRLHRELDKAQREGLYARIDTDHAGFLADRNVRLWLRFALVTEWAMAHLAAEINHDPRRLLLAKDVLYRPWRSWRDNEERCPLTQLGAYQEVHAATGDRDFAGHVAQAAHVLLEGLEADAFSSERAAAKDARTLAYLEIQRPPPGLASERPIEDTLRHGVERHAFDQPLLDRKSGKWLERPDLVHQLDIEHRLQRLRQLSCIEQVGGLERCTELLFKHVSKAPPEPAAIVQRARDVVAVAFLARALAALLREREADALDAVRLLVADVRRISNATLRRLGQHLELEDLDDLVEAMDAATFESRLKSRGELSPEALGVLRQAWLDDWLRRLMSPWDADDCGGLLDPVAKLMKWMRPPMWNWRRPERDPDPWVALWSAFVREAYAQQLPTAFGLVALDRLGFPLRRDSVDQAIERYAGSATVKARLVEVLQPRRMPRGGMLLLETAPDGPGMGWEISSNAAVVLLDTSREEAGAMRAWVDEQIEAPERIQRFGRVEPGYHSPPEGLTAYVYAIHTSPPIPIRPLPLPVIEDSGNLRDFLAAINPPPQRPQRPPPRPKPPP